MASTFKAPSGAKHDRCIDHVPHPFPKSGKLCIGPTIGREGMIAFADEIAAKTAAHRAEDLARVEAMHLAARPGGRVKSSRHKHIGGVPENRGIGEQAARFNARRGRTVEPDTYIAAVARKARVAKVAPIVEPEELPPGYTTEPEPVRRGPADAAVDMVRGPGWILSRAEAVAAGLTPPVEPEAVEEAPERCHFWRYGPVGAAPRQCLANEGHTTSEERDAHEWPDLPAVVVEEAPAEPEPVEPAPAPAPVLAVVASARPTCERCGQSFRKSGNGLAWHVANRPDCADRRLSVVA